MQSNLPMLVLLHFYIYQLIDITFDVHRFNRINRALFCFYLITLLRYTLVVIYDFALIQFRLVLYYFLFLITYFRHEVFGSFFW